MNWSDESFLISKNRYSENSLISEIYTKSHGKVSGIIFGRTSKKIKNYLQIGNKLHVNYSSKNENRIGYFKIEILNAYSPLYFDHKQKLSCRPQRASQDYRPSCRLLAPSQVVAKSFQRDAR